MASAFGWLDTDEAQRRKVLDIVQLFKEQGTVDEMGVASVRDSFSNALFPGTSVQHTRLRYALFIPWLLEAASHKDTPDLMERELRRFEVRLIDALGAGGETEGVIGRISRGDLKRMPSSAYWALLGTWGLRTEDVSAASFFRQAKAIRALNARASRADDVGSAELGSRIPLDPHLPAPPADWLESITFDLTPVEEGYLSARIQQSTPRSLLAWLVLHEPAAEVGYVWDLPETSCLPDHMGSLVDHARRFSLVINGAALLYNLILARRRKVEEWVERFEQRIAEWREEVLRTGAVDGWEVAELWRVLSNPRIHPFTRDFVAVWVGLVASDSDVASSVEAERVVSRRERQIKGGRARLVNQSALDRWTGDTGTGRLDFRWGITQGYLRDLYAARRADART